MLSNGCIEKFRAAFKMLLAFRYNIHYNNSIPCAAQLLKMLLEEAKKRGIRRVLIGAHTSNVGSCKTIEKCGFSFVEEIQDPYDENERIRKYSIDNR